jgi:hypothetical protein
MIRRQFGNPEATLQEIYLAVARGETKWLN